MYAEYLQIETLYISASLPHSPIVGVGLGDGELEMPPPPDVILDATPEGAAWGNATSNFWFWGTGRARA